MIGRLAPGTTLDRAQAELTTIGAQMAAEQPSTHRLLRPEVMPFAASIVPVGPMMRVALWSINIFIVLLLVLVSDNVALLMFARTASREKTIVIRSALGALSTGVYYVGRDLQVRRYGAAKADALRKAPTGDYTHLENALGASRGRMVSQFFAEALVLGGGVMPALKVTRGLQSKLRSVTAGGGGLKFGGVWTVVIVAQVALTVTFPATAFFTKRDGVQIESMDNRCAAGACADGSR